MNEVLPLGWAATQLGCVCGLLNGRAYKQAELLRAGKYRVLRVGNFFSNTSWYYSDLELEPAKYCDNGDLLYAWSASFGPKIWDGGKAIYHYHIWRTQPNEGVVARRFLYYWFEWDKENIKAEHGTGSTMIHVTKGDMENRPLRLPPLPEQRRIVAKIDSLSSKSKRAREHLDHIPRLVEKYKQAVLAAAFRGELTAEWRAQRQSLDWRDTSIGHLLTAITAGKNLRCEERPPRTDERGVVKVSAVTWGEFDPLASKTLPASFSPPEDTLIRDGDLLISRANTLDLVGAVVLVRQAPMNLYLSDKILRLEMQDGDKPWVMWFLRSPLGRRSIEAAATGNQLSMRNLSQKELKALRLPWPEATERKEIVRRIDRAFTWIDRLAAEATSARTLIDKLDQAVLAKAFRGELVPQDPNDEPASVLLERIRAEREAVPAAKPGRGRARRS